jgi:hypothetical protein
LFLLGFQALKLSQRLLRLFRLPRLFRRRRQRELRLNLSIVIDLSFRSAKFRKLRQRKRLGKLDGIGLK